MDFIDCLPRSLGKSAILVVVDRLTKYAHFIPLSHPYTSKTIASPFIDNIYKFDGLPKVITSDRDNLFMTGFWQEFSTLQGPKLHFSTTYHPQTDDQSEVVNKCLETYLRCFCAHKPRDWVTWMPWAQFWYNTSNSTNKLCMADPLLLF